MKKQFLNMLPNDPTDEWINYFNSLSESELRELIKKSGIQYRQIIGFIKGINTITLTTLTKIRESIQPIKEN